MKAVRIALVASVMLMGSSAAFSHPLAQCLSGEVGMDRECEPRGAEAPARFTMTMLKFRVSQALPQLRSVRAKPDLSSWAYQAYFNPFVAGGLGGQCTAFAFGRALEVTGRIMDFDGNPNTWVSHTRYSVGTRPKAGALAVWSGVTPGGPGHVAFVESVQDGAVTITEANVSTFKDTNYGGGYDGAPRTFTEREMNDRMAPETGRVGRLLGYIYLQ